MDQDQWEKVCDARERRMGKRNRHRVKELARLNFGNIVERWDGTTVRLDLTTMEEDAEQR